MTPYKRLEEAFATISHLEGAIAMLHWDAAVMMPEGGANARSEQLATLSALIHSHMVAPTIEEWLEAAKADQATLDPWQKTNLHHMYRMWLHASAVDQKLVMAQSRAASECEMVWRKARPANDFKTFAPYLSKVVALTREVAAAKAARLGVAPYDALLDYYDPGRHSSEIDRIFAELKAWLPRFIQEVTEHQRSKPAILPLQPPFPLTAQRALGERVMQALGFDFHQGRLDVSAHPFCGGIPSDIRITTRYNEQDFWPALMGVIHETGHALYEQQLPITWRNQPVGRAQGMSMHESQSLLMEMQACRSRAFLGFLQPHLKEVFHGEGPAWEAENLYRMVTRVNPSLIRVDADEVTYPAHVILRYELEKALLSRELEVENLPGAWNEGMQRLLGVTPPSDKDGCMQDIHWTGGDFGYFPTYSLGAMVAAQLFTYAKEEDKTIVPAIQKGDFSPLVRWLGTNVHGYGSLYDADGLLTHVTKRPIDVACYMTHLRTRYLEEQGI